MLDTLRFGGQVALPILFSGVIARRPRAMAAIDRLQLDRTAIAAMRRLRQRYGPRPLRLRMAGRSMVVLLAPEDVHRVLAESPDPFTPASREKVSALAHFQPHGVLISQGEVRTQRRRFNEDVLDTGQPLHRLADSVTAKARAEAGVLVDAAMPTGRMTWHEFGIGWWQAVRRITLGDHARDDETVTDLLATLRADANWAYLRSPRRATRDRFLWELHDHIEQAEQDSLAALVRDTPAAPGVEPAGQVPHWLFAFDAAAIVTFRALALLATHPEHAGRVRAELAGRDLSTPQNVPYVRACVLESVRLWPTSPAVLRDSTTATTWRDRTFRAGTSFLVFAPFFHRDARTLPYADEFTPEIWLDGRAADNPALVPFSAGPVQCLGRDLVLFVAGTMLAALLEQHRYRLRDPGRLGSHRPLPASLNNYGLDFEVEPLSR